MPSSGGKNGESSSRNHEKSSMSSKGRYGSKDSQIVWVGSPRNQMLLKWLGDHETERNVLFSQRRDVQKRGEIFSALAKHIFSEDREPEIRRQYRQSDIPFASSIQNRIIHFKRVYQNVHAEIGGVAARLTLEQLREDKVLRPKIDSIMAKFPEWRQLHGYWRKLSHINFASKTPYINLGGIRKTGEKKSTKGNVPPAKEIEIIELSDSDDDYTDTKINEKENRKPPEHRNNAKSLAPSRQNKLKRKIKEESPEIQELLSSSKLNFSEDQRYNLELAGLKIKKQKLENEALDKKAAIETHRLQIESDRAREREQHELAVKALDVVLSGKGSGTMMQAIQQSLGKENGQAERR